LRGRCGTRLFELDNCEAAVVVMELQEDDFAKLLKLMRQGVRWQWALDVHHQHSRIREQSMKILMSKRQ
jgi:hypothetical protein